MIIEEKKADEKVCCGPNIEVGIGCAGSRCMAWRWAEEPDPNFVPNHPMVLTAPNNPATAPSPWRKSTTHGFCGLAGRP